MSVEGILAVQNHQMFSAAIQKTINSAGRLVNTKPQIQPAGPGTPRGKRMHVKAPRRLL